MRPGEHRDVVVIGGGLAGLSATVQLARSGARVQLLDRRPMIGGRAYSYVHPGLGEVVDSQHVMLRCCTNLIAFCEKIGAADKIRWYDEFTFLEPAALAGEEPRRSLIGPSALPAPLHNTLSFLRAPMLAPLDKLRIAQGLGELRTVPAEDSEPFATFLARTRQTDRAFQHFWKPVVISGLNDVAERCSTRYAALLFQETFLKNRDGGQLGIPMQPLSEFYAAGVRAAEACGAEVRLGTGVQALERAGDGRWCVQLADGERVQADAVVLAMPFDAAAALARTLAADEPARAQIGAAAEQFVHAPITSVHVWFDRAVTELHHAVLLDTHIEWFFNKTLIRRADSDSASSDSASSGSASSSSASSSGGRTTGQYLELTISASFAELRMERQALIDRSLAELARFLPRMRDARVVKAGVTKEARATFSVTPGLDRNRPSPVTSSAGLYLAGDWTRTEWPSTMEGAVRSGVLAAEAVLQAAGAPARLLAPDLPATGLMRWLSPQR